MLHIDATLLEAGNRLDGDARRPLYVHPVTGSMLVERFHDYPRQVARAILEHHERLDGSGYPRGLVGGAISPLGRLLSLCEVVTGMFDGRRERPEERVSLLLRVSPQRFDQNLVPSIHRLLRALPPTEAVVESTVAESALRLRMLADLLGQWHAAAAASTGLAAPAQAVVRAMAEQAVNLQRMLLQAGISTEQLEMLGPEDETDNTLRAELQALSRELGWHLRASANQLRRRWRGVAEATRFPPAIASWLDAVEALDAAA